MFPTIVYQCPGVHQCSGGTYKYLAAETRDIYNNLLKDGWFATLTEAQAGIVKDKAPATRTELEAMAKELGIKVDGRKSDATLESEIEKALEV